MHVDTYATGTKPDKEILASVLKAFDFRPGEPARVESRTPHWLATCQHAVRHLSAVSSLSVGPHKKNFKKIKIHQDVGSSFKCAMTLDERGAAGSAPW